MATVISRCRRCGKLLAHYRCALARDLEVAYLICYDCRWADPFPFPHVSEFPNSPNLPKKEEP